MGNFAVDRRSLLLALGAAALPLPVFAADPWEKEFSQWTDKDIQRIMTDSPWSKNVSVPFGPGGGGMSGGSRGGGGGRRGGGGGSGGGPMGDASAPSAGASSGMGGGGGAPGGGDMSPSGGGVPSINFQIRWQSAASIKAALVRSKMGKEADTSAEAKAFIEKEEETYVVALIMPGMGGEGAGPAGAPAGGPDAEKRITDSTTHFWKGHEDIHPVKVIMPKQNSPAFVFHFAKTHAIELEDKEVEFATRRGPMEIKKKFRLRDMVYNGKLAL